MEALQQADNNAGSCFLEASANDPGEIERKKSRIVIRNERNRAIFSLNQQQKLRVRIKFFKHE